MKRPIALLGVTVMMLLGLVGVTGPAQAKVPGPNGADRVQPLRPFPGRYGLVRRQSRRDPLAAGLPWGIETPHWSPDGSKIALLACVNPPVCDTAAVILDPDTGNFLALTMPDPDLFSACALWSPDAERLACEGFGQTDPGRNGIYTIRTSDGQGLIRVTSNPGGDDLPIDYSPDGNQIVFGRTRPHGTAGALFVVNVDGTGLHRITPWGFSDNDGSWSPDGKTIVFEHFGSLYTVHPDGSGLSMISLQTASSSTTAFPAFDAGWSPDGTKIVFSLRMKTGPNTVEEGIATANVDGSDVQLVTTSPTTDEQADWGPHPLAT